jgi:hypothetical protein
MYNLSQLEKELKHPTTRTFLASLLSGSSGESPFYPFFNSTSDFLTTSRANDLCACAYSNDKVKQLWTNVGHKYNLLQFLEFMNHEGR